jgi:hypothetical protein
VLYIDNAVCRMIRSRSDSEPEKITNCKMNQKWRWSTSLISDASEFSWRDWGNPLNSSVRISCIWGHIWTLGITDIKLIYCALNCDVSSWPFCYSDSLRVGRTGRRNLQGRRISQKRNQRESGWQAELLLCYSSTLKMEATCSSETSVDLQRTTWRYVSEDRFQ